MNLFSNLLRQMGDKIAKKIDKESEGKTIAFDRNGKYKVVKNKKIYVEDK